MVSLYIFAAVAARSVTLVQSPEHAQQVFVAGLALTALAVVAAIAMRSRAGVNLGWLVQAGTVLYGLVMPMMLAVAAIFIGIWVLALRKGRKMDAMTDQHVATSGSSQQ